MVLIAVWAILGALLVLGILLPELSSMAPREPSPRPIAAFVALPILLAATLAIEARGRREGVRLRTAFALGTMHFVLADAYFLLFWRGFDVARDIYGDPLLRAGFWALNVAFAYVGVGPHDLARLDRRGWRLALRAPIAGAGLALSSVVLLSLRAGDPFGWIVVLPLAAFFAVPLGLFFGALFGAVDLAMAAAARVLAPRRAPREGA